MRVLKLSALVLLALAVVVIGIGAMLPKDFAVERSIEINASPEAVFDEVNSLKKWDAWSPWIARDPSLANTHSGPDAGVGAMVTWTSEESGDGRQTITSANADANRNRLDFGDMGQPNAYWTFEPSGEGVHVTWGCTAPRGLLAATSQG